MQPNVLSAQTSKGSDPADLLRSVLRQRNVRIHNALVRVDGRPVPQLLPGSAQRSERRPVAGGTGPARGNSEATGAHPFLGLAMAVTVVSLTSSLRFGRRSSAQSKEYFTLASTRVSMYCFR